MTNKVGIDVTANFDGSKVTQGLNKVTEKVNQANKGPAYNPVDSGAEQAVSRLNKQLEQLLRIDGELRRRLKATGQSGLPFEQWDMGAMYPNDAARRSKEAAIRRYLNGEAPSGPGGGGGFGRFAAPIAQAGLSAAGPIGGVASKALGTGMSAGAGAGLAGLLGGLAALGLGKAIGGIVENVGKAEENNIALDRLKRTLGDVNVSFNALKTTVRGSADSLKITYADATGLAQQFVKQGGIGSGQYQSLGSELNLGVGMSRAFGLDPSQGMGFLGGMRGVGMTSNTQESRRMALLIGETIGKAGAFAKAEEVMDAISGFAQSQTRATLGRANVDGYAGMFSAMVGARIPGMDPANAASILSRVNSALSAGGAKGEASQFLTARVGQSLGLDPLQTQIFREGGMFATKRGMFGKGSAYARYMGSPMAMGADADVTHWQARLDMIKRDPSISGNPLLMALAMAGDTGLSMNQAMELMKISPNKMGEMKKYNLGNLSGSGIGNLSKALYGSDADRSRIAQGLLNRNDVSGEDKQSIREALKGQGSLSDVLARMTAKYDQERTLGSDIRDSKAALDNIKTAIADRLVPYTQTMRDGIVLLAGKGKSPREISEEVQRLEAKDKLATLPERAASESAARKLQAIQKEKENLKLEFRKQYGKFTNNPDEYYRQLKEVTDREIAATEAANRAKKAYTKATEDATQELEDSINDIRKGLPPGTTSGRRASLVSGINQSPAETARLARSGNDGGAPPPGAAPSTGDAGLDAKLAAAEKRTGLPPGTLRAVIGRETGRRKAEFLADPSKYHYGLDANGRRIAPHTGRTSTAFGPFGILESTANDPGYGVAPLQSKELDEQIRFASEYLAARARRAGSLAGGLAGYGEGWGYSNGVMNNIPEQTPVVRGGDQAAGGKGEVGKAEVTVKVVNEKGQEIAPQQVVQTKVPRPNPRGATASW